MRPGLSTRASLARWRFGISAIALATVVSGACRSQEKRVSPHETGSQVVDGVTITITYGRPSKRGRAIFGTLVPYDQVWMPGADESTILRTGADLQIGTVRLPAGSYSLYTLPSASGWKLIVNKQTGQPHTEYHAEQDVARIDMRLDQLEQSVEQLVITSVPRPEGGGELRIEWDTLRAAVAFAVARP
jgi:hypothetical protein